MEASPLLRSALPRAKPRCPLEIAAGSVLASLWHCCSLRAPQVLTANKGGQQETVTATGFTEVCLP